MHKDTSWLPFWEGFRVVELKLQAQEVRIQLEAQTAQAMQCGHCCRACDQVHERLCRRVRDLPMLGYPVTLEVHLCRVACPDCGQRVQHVPWLARYARLTQRLAQAASACCARLPIAHVAELFGLHWSTVRELDRQRMQAQVDALPPAQPRRLVMDEFALFKGHRYASVILDADTRRVLWVAEGRSRKSVRPFFEELGKAGCTRIEAVAMDMNSAFDLEVRRHCAKARVVYDLFHVVAKYGREVISRVRVDAANQLRQDKPARRVVKQAHWLLLRNRKSLSDTEQVRLDEVLAVNAPLMTSYLMKEQLRALWTAPTAWEWRRRWKQWLAHAEQSAIPALQRFARTLQPYWRGIVSRVRWPMHTGQLEGINNRIKVIKRMAYGYRDTEYFFLKIRSAFPGNP
ncbi:ISL3 family transposase [Paucibacter sp. KBW04]|uniref:ISL3 family transposase n=1 Tax=Paucibacter sp. KBW04 TaxID=2153361 RepID=UPI000F575D97|nr:ISL3 family transposase [Paucibacter sp. KBW04]RQO63520.1 ISL3 family transposase [Paucibacter sp. KBW04]